MYETNPVHPGNADAVVRKVQVPYNLHSEEPKGERSEMKLDEDAGKLLQDETLMSLALQELVTIPDLRAKERRAHRDLEWEVSGSLVELHSLRPYAEILAYEFRQHPEDEKFQIPFLTLT